MNDKIKESFEASIIGLKKHTKTMFDQLMAPIEKRSMSMEIIVEQACVLQEIARREGRRIKVQSF
jgi:hypothetical protein